VLRGEAISASLPQENQMFQHKPASRVSSAPVPTNRHVPESTQEAPSRGFFKRMADVGRSFSARHDAEQESQEPRVQVVQKPSQAEGSPRSSKTQDEDQYLDIPAFLRRQNT
jgi:hypothetical protein